MKKNGKVVVTMLCAAMLVCASVMGTLAYLTDTAEVKNTFTIGNVNIDMDEADVDINGNLEYKEDNTTLKDRVKANEYKLMPGHSYVKDPIVYVEAGSENAYIFIKVENDIEKFEAASSDSYKTIAEQITNKDTSVANDEAWTALTGVEGVYYREYTSSTSNVSMPVFQEFVIADNANTTPAVTVGQGNEAQTVPEWTLVGTNTKVNVTAYAVQKDGFSTALDAWNATFGAVSGS